MDNRRKEPKIVECERKEIGLAEGIQLKAIETAGKMLKAQKPIAEIIEFTDKG